MQVALGVGVVAFRWDMPLSLRCAFFPILGDTVNGLVGDVIDGREACVHACVYLCESVFAAFVRSAGIVNA